MCGREAMGMFRWWRDRAERRRLVAADAAALIESFGDHAYYIARERARSERKSGIVFDANRAAGHWDRVRREIGRRTRRDGLDTATRYLVEREREERVSGRG